MDVPCQRRELARVRRGAFHTPPQGRNAVWRLDFPEYSQALRGQVSSEFSVSSPGKSSFGHRRNNALVDIAHYADRRSDQRLVICVLNDRDLNQVTGNSPS